jgi:hypothetical protein
MNKVPYRPNRIPRGIRNNNPGNLIISRIPWKGKVPVKENSDKKFEQFYKMVFGIRAMIMDIKNDIVKKELDTIQKLISVYAPPNENDTISYIKSVSEQTGINKDDTIIVERDIFPLVKAISFHENGGHFITNEQIEEAYGML